MMKKFAMTALAAAALLGAGAAQAYTVGTFSNGVVVPNVWHNGIADTTAVGFINKSAPAMAGDSGLRSVYWTFFDQNSMHITDGCFPMTMRDYEPFVWAAQSGVGMAGKRGYLVFALANVAAPLTAASVCKEAAPVIGAPGAPYRLSANAFQVDTANHDVAFTPVIDGDLTLLPGANLTSLGPLSLESVAGAAQVDSVGFDFPVMNMRYYIDQAPGGNDSFIVVWSTGDQRGTHTVNIYDDKQNRKSVNFPLEFTELDWFNVESIAGLPSSFTDGYIEWNPSAILPADFPSGGLEPALYYGGSVYTYTWMIAPAFGAVQTLLGAHHVLP